MSFISDSVNFLVSSASFRWCHLCCIAHICHVVGTCVLVYVFFFLSCLCMFFGIYRVFICGDCDLVMVEVAPSECIPYFVFVIFVGLFRPSSVCFVLLACSFVVVRHSVCFGPVFWGIRHLVSTFVVFLLVVFFVLVFWCSCLAVCFACVMFACLEGLFGSFPILVIWSIVPPCFAHFGSVFFVFLSG